MPDLTENSTSLRDFYSFIGLVGKSSKRRAAILPGRLMKHIHRQTSKSTNEKLNMRAGNQVIQTSWDGGVGDQHFVSNWKSYLTDWLNVFGLWSSEDEAYWLWAPPDVSSSNATRLTRLTETSCLFIAPVLQNHEQQRQRFMSDDKYRASQQVLKYWISREALI